MDSELGQHRYSTCNMTLHCFVCSGLALPLPSGALLSLNIVNVLRAVYRAPNSPKKKLKGSQGP